MSEQQATPGNGIQSEPAAVLTIGGAVNQAQTLTWRQLSKVDTNFQVADVGTIVPGRQGCAVRLTGLAELAGITADVDFVTLHASHDDFHASVPLADVASRGLLVYADAGEPLPTARGGPFRFLIDSVDACQASDVDECANVKFVDRIEFSVGRGHDNRPTSDAEHQRLHDAEGH